MLSERKLTTKLDEWAKLQKKANRIEENRQTQLAPLIDTFEAKAAPINTEADRQLDPILDELRQIAEELNAELLGRIGADGSIPIAQIETAAALAQVTTDRKRAIDPAAFLRSVPPSQRHLPAFAGCLTVLIAKAEKFLDARTMARIAKPKLSHSVTVTLKS